MLVLAVGGSNGHRPRLWKACLQERIVDRYSLHVTVCHDPAGASKWNSSEHRLLDPASDNRVGQTLPLQGTDAETAYAELDDARIRGL